MKVKIFLVFLLVLTACGIGCRTIRRIVQCEAALGGNNIPFVAIYPDFPATQSYRGRTDSRGIATYPSKGFDCNRIELRVGNTFGFSLTANPSSLYLPAPPASGTITGQGMSSAYGMPLVEYFDGSGYLIGSVTATAVSSDGTRLEAPFPDLSNVYDGSYVVMVTNMSVDGHPIEEVGTASGTGWGRPRVDSDGDGWYDDEDCYPDDARQWDCSDPGGGECCGPGCYCY